MDITIFDFNGRTVRQKLINGEPWFAGKDVCACLGLVNSRDALRSIPDDERYGVRIPDTIGREQEVICINEPGIYRLVLKSRKPEAEKFKNWLFYEVMPSIRKTGSYSIDRALDPDDLARKLNLVRETRLTHGKRAAQAMWSILDLPDIGDNSPDTAQEQDSQLSGQLVDFIEEVTENDHTSRVKARELYTVYKVWSRTHSAPVMTETKFGLMMKNSGIRKEMGRVRVYCGIRIKVDVRRKLEAGA